METEENKALQDIARWSRIGLMGFTVLAPIANTVASLLRERTRLSQQEMSASSPDQLPNTTETDETNAAYYTQQLLKWGESATEELRGRGKRLSQTAREQAGKVTQDLTERSSNLAQDLIQRGDQASHEFIQLSEKLRKDLSRRGEKAARKLARRSDKAARKLARRRDKAVATLRKRRKQITRQLTESGRTVTQGLTERDGRFWSFIGFGIGLTAAAIVAYLFINKRRQSQQEEEEEHILLTLDDRTFATPVDASPVLIGVISTKSYYPIDTPLDQLVPPEDQASNIIYFSSEEDAIASGFSAAPAIR